MKNIFRSVLSFLNSRRGLVALFALFCALFQLFVLTRARLFYPILRVLFFVLLLQLAAALVRAASRHRLLWLAVLLVFLIRLPFYLHADGAILTSDNAHEALQAAEMRDTHVAPFFLLGAVRHMGTIRYLMVAFLWDVTGNSYLVYLLAQTLLFVVVLFILYDLLRDSLHPPALAVFLFGTQLAFIETAFDYSLSLRGAPYLEMVFFILLGAGLIDWTFRDWKRCFLGYYFLFFAVYIHPLAVVIVGSFGLGAFIFSVVRKKILPHLALAGAGAAAGLYHWFCYLLFWPKPISGTWEQIGILSPSGLSPRYLGGYLQTLSQIFQGIFGAEYSYLGPLYTSGRALALGTFETRAVVWLSLAVVLAALVLAARRIVRLVRRKEALMTADWPFFFVVILAVAFALKAFLLYPPHLEPRHNFDLVLLIVFSYLAVFSWMRRLWKFPLFGGVVVVLAFVLALPHYWAYLQNVRDKEFSYREILSVLRANRVRYVTTDFIVAYPLYFLSGRKIIVTDSLGPFTLMIFYPDLRAQVDAVPPDRKAYLFFGPEAPNRPWHKKKTRQLLAMTFRQLKEAGILYQTYKLKYYILIIPRHVAGAKTSLGP